jgi:hypothetical protein
MNYFADFMRVTILSAAVLPVFPVIADAAPKSKPDIIFLMTDQQRWDAIGINNPHIKTPNLDRLAQQGILFNQATYKNPILNADYPDVDVEQLGRCRLV